MKAIGVDVDQYLTFPEAGSVLITSVMKNVDVAAGVIVQKFAAGKLTSGINSFDLKSGAVGLAPFHEWEDKIPQACKDLVAQANKKLVLHPEILKGETEY
ncbi:MAG: BMP family ABC transporter substrate-binding protein [Desulfobacteraceae bacterium]|nr:MAG: BMP family ABC transporter substrate-binding protein [Desulfobacteraceae bacterium]